MEIVRPAKIVLVYAHWCPHCVPVSTEPVDRLGALLGVPVQLLDIDVPGEEIDRRRTGQAVRRLGGGLSHSPGLPGMERWAGGASPDRNSGIPGRDPTELAATVGPELQPAAGAPVVRPVDRGAGSTRDQRGLLARVRRQSGTSPHVLRAPGRPRAVAMDVR